MFLQFSKMNKLKFFFLKFIGKALKKLLWMLGLAGFGVFTSCTEFPDDPVAMYGIPYPDNYINFKGKVMSEDSLLPISNIKIKAAIRYYDTVYAFTDNSGSFSMHQFALEDDTVKLIFSDIDSTLNGSFYSKSENIVVSFRDVNNLEHKATILLERKP